MSLEGLPAFDGTKEGKVPIKKKEDLVNNPTFKAVYEIQKANDLESMFKCVSAIFECPSSPEMTKMFYSHAQQILDGKNFWDAHWATHTCNLTDYKIFGNEGSGAILKIKSKTLLLYAENDTMVPQESFKQFSNYLGGYLTTVQFKDGKHALGYLFPE